MPAINFPPCPPALKSIQHYLKTATEHDGRDIVISYWCRLYALQQGLKIDKSNAECKKFLIGLMDWLEKTKAEQKENDAVTHDIPAQAHLENYALKLFLWADSKDRAAEFDKNVVKAFYTSGMIFDVLETFGELTEEVQQNRKYAKWKAAYIHNCLKSGETPVPGPMQDDNERTSAPGNIGFSNLPDIPQASNPVVQPLDNVLPTVPTVSNYQNPGTVSTANIPDFTDVNKVNQVFGNTGSQLSTEQITKAQKYCKFAASALNYDDVTTAITNLQKALTLLTTGTDE